MDRERLRGTAISTVVMVVASVVGLGAPIWREPVLLLWLVPMFAVAAYYLWPWTITGQIAPARGVGLAPSGLRLAQAGLITLAAVLGGVLIGRVFGGEIGWWALIRTAVGLFAVLYLVWSPPRAVRAPATQPRRRCAANSHPSSVPKHCHLVRWCIEWLTWPPRPGSGKAVT